MRPSFLLPFFMRLYRCVVVMLHERVNDYITQGLMLVVSLYVEVVNTSMLLMSIRTRRNVFYC